MIAKERGHIHKGSILPIAVPNCISRGVLEFDGA